MQKYFLSNEFTRTAFSKVDVRTQREIQGAEMTLYRAEVDTEGKPVTDENGNYVKGEAVAAWISGYECDDRGESKARSGWREDSHHKAALDRPHSGRPICAGGDDMSL